MKHIIVAILLLAGVEFLPAQTTDAALALAGDFFERAQWEQAVDAFDHAGASGSLSDREQNRLAYALMELGRYERARSILEGITARHPEAYAAWYNLGIAHLNCGRYISGLVCFRLVTEHDSLWASGWFGLGICHLLMGQIDLAWEALGSLIALDEEMAAELLESIQAEEVYRNDPAEQ
jgi:tetratricopeptide (TPR) repeat protein